MIEATVIIIGGGPAGSACARELGRHGVDSLVLDKRSFPRTKLCAGWITPKVLADLELDPKDYPHSILACRRIRFHFRGLPVPVPTYQYSIRRREFDDFLLKRAGAPVYHHDAVRIRRSGARWVIDDAYRAAFLVGAGGTFCPVYRSVFSHVHPRDPGCRIVTAEEEFPFAWTDPQCRLWFFDHGLPGYGWYVPKQNGWLNVGIGGMQATLKKRGKTINAHWRRLVQKLARQGLTSGRRFCPRGHTYYLRGKTGVVEKDNAFIAGDAAGLATRDMGEGIGPAIESGILTARAIAGGNPYSVHSVTRYSAPQILGGMGAKKPSARKKTAPPTRSG